MGITRILAEQRQYDGQESNSIDSLHAKLPSKNLEGENKQHRIDKEIGVLHRYTRSPIDD